MSGATVVGYAQTELGVLPTDWKTSPLRLLLDCAPRYGINAAAVPDDGSLPTYIRITDISEDGKFRPEPRVAVNDPSSGSYFLSPGDIVVARTGASVGKSYLYDVSDGGLVFAGFLICITPNQRRLDSRYFAYCMQSSRYWDWVRRTSMRSGQPGINGREYASLIVAVPELSEQQRISEALLAADNLTNALERIIAKNQDIKQGMMQQLLTGKTRLPGFNRPWTEVRLGDHVSYIKAVALSRAQLDSQSPLRYLHYGDIHTSASVTLDAAHHEMPRAKSALARNAGRLQVGDLVFADASEDQDGVGKSVEIVSVPKEGAIPGLHTIAARFNKSVLANGFTAYLQFNPQFRNALLRLAAGTKVLATTRSYISSVQLSLPGVDEQRAIAQVLLDADGEIFALQEKLDKARAIKQGMMQELLTGRTRLPVKRTAA